MQMKAMSRLLNHMLLELLDMKVLLVLFWTSR